MANTAISTLIKCPFYDEGTPEHARSVFSS